MPYTLWKIIRNTLYFFFAVSLFLLIGNLVDASGYSSFSGMIALLIIISWFVYVFSFKVLGRITLFMMFFPFTIGMLFANQSTRYNCNRCNRELNHTGNWIHEVNVSKGFVFNLINKRFYDVKTAQEIRCYSELCYPRNDLFQTNFRKDFVFLTKHRVMKRYYQDRHSITNLSKLDIVMQNQETI